MYSEECKNQHTSFLSFSLFASWLFFLITQRCLLHFPQTIQLSLQDPHHDFPGPPVDLSSFNLPEDLSRPREVDWHFLHKPCFHPLHLYSLGSFCLKLPFYHPTPPSLPVTNYTHFKCLPNRPSFDVPITCLFLSFDILPLPSCPRWTS